MLLKRRYDRPPLAEIIPSRWDAEPIARAQSRWSDLSSSSPRGNHHVCQSRLPFNRVVAVGQARGYRRQSPIKFVFHQVLQAATA